jgi:hypothetical protein
MQFALLDRERKKKKAEMSTETPNPFPNSRLGVLPVSVIRWLLALSPVIPYKKRQTKCVDK